MAADLLALSPHTIPPHPRLVFKNEVDQRDKNPTDLDLMSFGDPQSYSGSVFTSKVELGTVTLSSFDYVVDACNSHLNSAAF